MEWYWRALIEVYCLITCLSATCVVLCGDRGEILDEALNPTTIYKNRRVNIFGCILLTILGHVLFSLCAPFYWLYKLCTVGRK